MSSATDAIFRSGNATSTKLLVKSLIRTTSGGSTLTVLRRASRYAPGIVDRVDIVRWATTTTAWWQHDSDRERRDQHKEDRRDEEGGMRSVHDADSSWV